MKLRLSGKCHCQSTQKCIFFGNLSHNPRASSQGRHKRVNDTVKASLKAYNINVSYRETLWWHNLKPALNSGIKPCTSQDKHKTREELTRPAGNVRRVQCSFPIFPPSRGSSKPEFQCPEMNWCPLLYNAELQNLALSGHCISQKQSEFP